jgi:uncharacterized integral membrane protein
MAILWLLLGAALVVVGSVFYVQNQQATDLHFWTLFLPSVPLWLIAVVPALFGFLIGMLISVPGRLRGALTARRLTGQLQERDRTIGKLQERINELDRDLTIARAAPQPVAVEEHRIPDVPDGTARTETHAA